MNTAVNAVFNALASAIMIVVMYSCFRITGHLPNEFFPTFGGSIIGIWLFPVVVILPLAVWFRARSSGNPQPLSGGHYHGGDGYHYEAAPIP